METPREVYLNGCAFVADALSSHGFRYSPSKQIARRTGGEFEHLVSFQSSHRNVAGQSVALWIHANVRSRRLREWRAAQPRALRTDDFCGGGQIGNLCSKARWREWNLADPQAREGALADAVSTVQHVALPFFSLFDDVAALSEELSASNIPGLEPENAIEFLLCFASRHHASRYLSRLLRDRGDLLAQYQASLDQMRRDGLPPYRPNGIGPTLAAATLAYELPQISA